MSIISIYLFYFFLSPISFFITSVLFYILVHVFFDVVIAINKINKEKYFCLSFLFFNSFIGGETGYCWKTHKLFP